MRIGDVIYDNDTVLIASASFNKEEPCKECFFYDGHECQSNRYIECWDKSINKDLIMIPFENNKVQDSKMMDHSKITNMKKEEKKFVTEYQINGKKYAGEIWATSWEEAECFIKQRASTEKAVGFIPKD